MGMSLVLQRSVINWNYDLMMETDIAIHRATPLAWLEYLLIKFLRQTGILWIFTWSYLKQAYKRVIITDFPSLNCLLSPSSVTSHQRSSSESLACPCLPLIILRSGRRTNWRNRSDSSEKMKSPEPSNTVPVHCQQRAPKRSLQAGLLTPYWLCVAVEEETGWNKSLSSFKVAKAELLASRSLACFD